MNKLKYNSFSSGGCLRVKETDKLPGALAAFQNFFYDDSVKDFWGPEAVHNYSPVATFVPTSSGISMDNENDIFVKDGKAVADAFDLTHLSADERLRAIDEIIMERKLMYPDYDFVMLPGNFPIYVEGGLTENGKCVRSASANMSSHILYINDYKRHLVNNKNNQYRKK